MIRFSLGEHLFEVAVRESAGAYEVTVNGERFELEVAEIAPGAFVIRRGERVERLHAVRSGDTVHLQWRGRVHRLTEEREGARSAHGRMATGLEAPMPGKVIAVHVAPGQRVHRGEEVLVVEAMKMENAVRAPRDGTVKTVAVAVGDPVAPGIALVELE